MRAAESLLAPAPADPDKTATLVVFGLIYAYVLFLAGEIWIGAWLFDAAGRPMASDFVNVWAAGDLALSGNPAGAYDWTLHKSVENHAVGQDFGGYFGWHYPPPFLFLAAPLALLSYPVAHLVWMAATLPLYAAAIGQAAQRRGAWLAAIAFPAVIWNFTAGQNGFLTAALFGAALTQIERRPALAGVLIGLMTYKPQFGLLIPVALLAGAHWRVIFAATATALLVAAASALAFGLESWSAFIASSALTNRIVLVEGGANFSELLSAFGMSRWLGAPLELAWTLQGVVAAALAVAVWRTWRSPAPLHAKAALLASAALLATPYVYVYDLVVLAVPVAFLARERFCTFERTAVIAACVLILVGPLSGWPLAFPAPWLVAAAAFWRLQRSTAVAN